MPEAFVVHVIDDDESVRDSLAFLFDAADLPTRIYESALAFLAAGAGTGCVVTDVRMPEMSGIELLRELRSRGSAVPVIIMTGHGDVPLALEAVKAGAFDFLEKPFGDDALISSVRRALAPAGGDFQTDERDLMRARLSRLSEQERQVLDGLVSGRPSQAIADSLAISIRAVDVHRAKLMGKMEAGTFPALARMGLLAGATET